MKLLFGLSNVWHKGSEQSLVYAESNAMFLSGNAMQFDYEMGIATLSNYGLNNLVGSVEYKGQIVSVYERLNNNEWRIDNIRKGNCWVENETSEKLDLGEALTCVLAGNASANKLNFEGQMYSRVKNLNSDKTESLISYNIETDYYDIIEFDLLSPTKIDNDCYASRCQRRKIRLAKFSKELVQQWVYEDKGRFPYRGRFHQPLDNGDSIVVNLIAQKRDCGPGELEYVDGEVFCFDKEDGSIVWQRKFEKQVDDCQFLDKQRLALFTNNEIHILNSESGDTQDVINTDFDVLPADTRMFVHTPYLFMFNNAAKSIHIYDIKSMECIRKVDVAGYQWRLDREPRGVNGKIYLEVPLPRLCSGLLIIDPNDIHAPLEIEVEPGFEIIDSTEEDGSVTIIADGITIDDLVRFGEVLVLEKMRYLGTNFWNHQPNPNFNGEIKLIYRNSPSDAARVKEVLDMMINRTKFFCEEDDCRCGKGNTPTSLSYTLE